MEEEIIFEALTEKSRTYDIWQSDVDEGWPSALPCITVAWQYSMILE